MTDPDSLEDSVLATARSETSELSDRIDWPRARLDLHRRAALRSLLDFARERSRWHRSRLPDIDGEDVPLESLPPMTRADLVEHFDEIVTDSRLTKRRCLDFLSDEERSTEAHHLDRDFQVTTTGGSTAEPVLVVNDLREIAIHSASLARFVTRWIRRTSPSCGPPVVAHITSAARRFRFHRVHAILPAQETHVFPITTPTTELVEGLNRAQPGLLFCYPSLLPRMATEAAAGRLRISPKLVLTGAEVLLPEHEAAVARAWQCPIMDRWGSSEVGALGVGSGFEPGMLLMDDLALIEPVDRAGRPVPPGELAEKLYVTSLYRRVVPLIRYELTDCLALLDEPPVCGSGFRRAGHVAGRAEDSFHYEGGACVEPWRFRDTFAAEPGILEYQLRQTPSGLTAHIVCSCEVDPDHLAARLVSVLGSRGVREPRVEVRHVPFIERDGAAAKLRRFVPIV